MNVMISYFIILNYFILNLFKRNELLNLFDADEQPEAFILIWRTFQIATQ